MINKPTVFVLGAGANVPYGFSTGGGLIDRARGKDPRKLMGDAGKQITVAQAAAFRKAVDDNLLPSIDAMLEHRPDLVRVGKRVMATILYAQEAKVIAAAFEDDWVAYLFSAMARNAPTVDQFAQNPISFITFNYDRYLEHRFIRGLVARYDADPREAWQKIKHMFTHAYGTLGPLPDQIPPGATGMHAVSLGARDQPGIYTLGPALALVEQTILTVNDGAASRAAFAECAKRFKCADQVFFLGFGFGEENVERLQVHSIPIGSTMFATTYGMTQSEINVLIIPAFPGRQPPITRSNGSNGSESIKRFLREFAHTLR